MENNVTAHFVQNGKRKFTESIGCVPRLDEFVRIGSDSTKDFRVTRVTWLFKGPDVIRMGKYYDEVEIQIEDPHRGHEWVECDEGVWDKASAWKCSRCDTITMSQVPLDHVNFPGTLEKREWVDECPEIIARAVMEE